MSLRSSKTTSADISAVLGVANMSADPVAGEPAPQAAQESRSAVDGKPAMRRLSVEISESQLVKLKLAAVKDGTSVSAIVRSWIDTQL